MYRTYMKMVSKYVELCKKKRWARRCNLRKYPNEKYFNIIRFYHIVKYLILQSQKIKLYDLLCIFLRGWVREFNYAKSTVLIDRVIFASWHYEIMLWTCCYTRKGCWLARLGRVSVAVVHGWTDETAHLEYAKSKSNPRKEKKIGWLGASSHTTRKYDSMASSRKDTLLAISWCTGFQKLFLIQNLPANLVTVRPHVIIRHGNMSSCH